MEVSEGLHLHDGALLKAVLPLPSALPVRMPNPASLVPQMPQLSKATRVQSSFQHKIGRDVQSIEPSFGLFFLLNHTHYILVL